MVSRGVSHSYHPYDLFREQYRLRPARLRKHGQIWVEMLRFEASVVDGRAVVASEGRRAVLAAEEQRIEMAHPGPVLCQTTSLCGLCGPKTPKSPPRRGRNGPGRPKNKTECPQNDQDPFFGAGIRTSSKWREIGTTCEPRSGSGSSA